MPTKPRKECAMMGCHRLTRSRYCDLHQDQEKKSRSIYDERRESRSKRGYDRKWYKFRETYLEENPLCVHCLRDGISTEATEIDHIIPHNGDKSVFWDLSNMQALCKSCHSRKTRQEQGGGGGKSLGGQKRKPSA